MQRLTFAVATAVAILSAAAPASAAKLVFDVTLTTMFKSTDSYTWATDNYVYEESETAVNVTFQQTVYMPLDFSLTEGETPDLVYRYADSTSPASAMFAASPAEALLAPYLFPGVASTRTDGYLSVGTQLPLDGSPSTATYFVNLYNDVYYENAFVRHGPGVASTQYESRTSLTFYSVTQEPGFLTGNLTSNFLSYYFDHDIDFSAFAYSRSSDYVGNQDTFDASTLVNYVGHARLNRELTVVPEPSAWALSIFGLGLTGTVLRRRRSVPIAA